MRMDNQFRGRIKTDVDMDLNEDIDYWAIKIAIKNTQFSNLFNKLWLREKASMTKSIIIPNNYVSETIPIILIYYDLERTAKFVIQVSSSKDDLVKSIKHIYFSGSILYKWFPVIDVEYIKSIWFCPENTTVLNKNLE